VENAAAVHLGHRLQGRLLDGALLVFAGLDPLQVAVRLDQLGGHLRIAIQSRENGLASDQELVEGAPALVQVQDERRVAADSLEGSIL
jgi:hypothetical protein